MHKRLLEGWRGKHHLGIVGEAEAFLGDSDEISVELVVAILIVDGSYSVISRRNIRPFRDGSPARFVDGCGAVPKGLLQTLRPAVRGLEDDCAEIANRIAESVHMNSQ